MTGADGMFAILVPAALTPLILTLFWGERQAKKLGLVAATQTRPDIELKRVCFPLVRRAWTFVQQLDMMGLLLVGTSVALILLPLTLASSAKGGWKNRRFSRAGNTGCLCSRYLQLR